MVISHTVVLAEPERRALPHRAQEGRAGPGRRARWGPGPLVLPGPPKPRRVLAKLLGGSWVRRCPDGTLAAVHHVSSFSVYGCIPEHID